MQKRLSFEEENCIKKGAVKKTHKIKLIKFDDFA